MIRNRQEITYLFSCSFSTEFWSRISLIAGASPHYDWDSLVHWGSLLKRKSLSNLISKLVWQASLYYIWLERNSRICSQLLCSPNAISGKVTQDIKLKLMSLPTSAVQAIDPIIASELKSCSLNVLPKLC